MVKILRLREYCSTHASLHSLDTCPLQWENGGTVYLLILVYGWQIVY
jgi:hypothetical protein